MSSSIGRFIMYTVIFLVVGFAVYFFAFMRPNARRVEALNHEIVAAQNELAAAALRDLVHPQLVAYVDQAADDLSREQENFDHVNREWVNEYARFMPEFVNADDLTQRIQRITTPHNAEIQVQESQPLGTMVYDENSSTNQPGLWLTPIHINLTVDYSELVQILDGFANEGIDNRITSYTLHRNGDLWDVWLRLDVLTQAASGVW